MVFGNKSTVRKLTLAWACALVLISPAGAKEKPGIKNERSSYMTFRSLARAYMATGDYAKAQPLAEKALALSKRENVADSAHCLCLLDLAYIHRNRGKFTDAEKMCKLGLQLQERLYYKDHPYVAYTLRILSSIYQGQGNYRRAQAALEEAIAIMLKSHLPDDETMGPFYVDTARVLTEQGYYEEAEVYYSKAMNLVNRSYGSDHPYTAAVLGSIARLYTLQERYDDAETLTSQTLAIQRRIYGPDHCCLIPTWLTIARICQAKGDLERAEKLLQKALAAGQEQQGPEHPSLGKVLNALSELYISEGEYAKAEGTCRQAVKLLEKSLGADNDVTAIAFHNLAQLYMHRGRYTDAENLCRRALHALEDIFDRNHPSVVHVLETMARVQDSLANTTAAARLVYRPREKPANPTVASASTIKEYH